MSNKETFWTSPDAWPRAVGHVFLAQAVHEMGRQMFREWTGSEPITPERSYESTQARLNRIALSQARNMSLSSSGGGSHSTTYPPAPLVKYDEAARARFLAVVSTLSRLAAKSELVTGTRAISGGAVEPLAANCWSTEGAQLLARFAFCQIDPAEPFKVLPSSSRHRYIFVSEESLAVGATNKGGRPSHQRDRAIQSLVRRFPDGNIPPTEKKYVLISEIAAEAHVSEDTAGRAMEEFIKRKT